MAPGRHRTEHRRVFRGGAGALGKGVEKAAMRRPRVQDDPMGEVTSTAERVIDAPATTVRAALADYAEVRPQILTPEFSDYRVESGGQGAGTRAHWKLAATKKRVRDCLVEVAESTDGSIVERDANSSMVTAWTVEPTGGGGSRVRVTTTWNGAGGIGGFFERRFAPKGLARIYDGVLANLEGVVRG
jgi:hypothetical protein